MKYRMPAEWELHTATWLAWPHNIEHWPGKFEPTPHVYCEIIHALAKSEEVRICVNDVTMENFAKELLLKTGGLSNVRFFHIPTNASWSRDHGPIFVHDENGKLVITDWIYNAWGGQWPCELDDVVPQKIGKILDVPVLETKMVLEGGSIDVNGKGTLLTTEQCLLNKNRNPHLNRAQIEKYLCDYLGATNVLWLKGEIAGDDTSGHVDDIARFVDPKTVVCATEENPKDINYKMLQQSFNGLKQMKDQDGAELKIIPLPMPDPVIYENQRLPASYANFYIANKVVIVPTFNDRHDAQVLDTFSKLFPTRKVIGINCVDLVWGFGALHCSTQQEPRTVSSPT